MTPPGPVPLPLSRLDLEQRLEDMIVDDPSLVGLPVLVVGRQVATKFGGYVDVLAVDAVDLQRLIQVIRDWQLVTEDVSPDVEDGSDLAGDTAESPTYGRARRLGRLRSGRRPPACSPGPHNGRQGDAHLRSVQPHPRRHR